MKNCVESVDGVRLRIDLRKYRSAIVNVRGGVHNLPRLRLAHSQLARHAIDAAGLRELRFGQTKLAILFAQLIANLLLDSMRYEFSMALKCCRP